MTTVSRLYEVVHIASYAGQEIVNRYNYLGTGDDGLSNPSLGLATQLGAAHSGTTFEGGSLFDNVSGFVVDALVWHQCLVRSIYVPTDFLDLPYPSGKPGQVSAQGEAPFVAIGFRSNRVRTDIGRGYKRFAGIGEGSVDALGVVNSTLLTNLAVTAGLLSDVLTYTADTFTWTFHPVIVGKFKDTTTEPGKTLYKYYPTESDQASHLASGITFEPYTVVRSQTSRQYGKGK